MDSVKNFANQCLPVNSPFRVVRDLFGLPHGAQQKISLKNQMRLGRGESIGINAIVVCPESLSDAQLQEIEFAIQGAREIYAKQGIGIRAVQWHQVSSADADTHCILGDDAGPLAEASDLTNDWTVDNDFLDVFFVQSITGTTIGWSAVDGRCSKNASSGMSGSVVGLEGSPGVSAVVLAHEVGHYLGLPHISMANNFMRSAVGSTNTSITETQGNKMKQKDCFVKDMC